MPLNVVYVDDEAELLEFFAEDFQSEEVKVNTYSDPAEAIAAIQANPPDLLFLDYQLPGTTGDQIALSLDPAIPKVLVTGNLSIVPKAVFHRILQKPVRDNDVRSLLNTFAIDRKSA